MVAVDVANAGRLWPESATGTLWGDPNKPITSPRQGTRAGKVTAAKGGWGCVYAGQHEKAGWGAAHSPAGAMLVEQLRR